MIKDQFENNQFLGAEIRGSPDRNLDANRLPNQHQLKPLKPKVTNMNIDNLPEIDFESLPLCEEAPQA
jgi:hypothetical protein